VLLLLVIALLLVFFAIIHLLAGVLLLHRVILRIVGTVLLATLCAVFALLIPLALVTLLIGFGLIFVVTHNILSSY
jgi:hypothetical protein